MNYQKEPPEKVLQILDSMRIEYTDLDYYAFPETFSSTSGPTDKVGGDVMSTFTVEAYVCDGIGPTVYICENEYKFRKGKFNASWKK